MNGLTTLNKRTHYLIYIDVRDWNTGIFASYIKNTIKMQLSTFSVNKKTVMLLTQNGVASETKHLFLVGYIESGLRDTIRYGTFFKSFAGISVYFPNQ